MNPFALNHPKSIWLLAVGMAVVVSFQCDGVTAQTSLADAEKVSAQTGRTLFVVAGKKT